MIFALPLYDDNPIREVPVVTYVNTSADVKATYDRPLRATGVCLPSEGGRVTELVARPLINMYWPQLAGFVQPLGGEYAARRL